MSSVGVSTLSVPGTSGGAYEAGSGNVLGSVKKAMSQERFEMKRFFKQ